MTLASTLLGPCIRRRPRSLTMWLSWGKVKSLYLSWTWVFTSLDWVACTYTSWHVHCVHDPWLGGYCEVKLSSLSRWVHRHPHPLTGWTSCLSLLNLAYMGAHVPWLGGSREVKLDLLAHCHHKRLSSLTGWPSCLCILTFTYMGTHILWLGDSRMVNLDPFTCRKHGCLHSLTGWPSHLCLLALLTYTDTHIPWLVFFKYKGPAPWLVIDTYDNNPMIAQPLPHTNRLTTFISHLL